MTGSLEIIGLIAFFALCGFILIVIDILFVPGSFLVIAGVCMIGYSLYLNYQNFGWIPPLIQFFLCLAVTPFLVIWGLNKASLKQELTAEEGYVGLENRDIFIGETAWAHTDLRPSGTIRLPHQSQDLFLDCVSSGEYIEKGDKVKVIASQGPSLVVEKFH